MSYLSIKNCVDIMVFDFQKIKKKFFGIFYFNEFKNRFDYYYFILLLIILKQLTNFR